jgi:NADPH:quinone reductase-like Zn-dependent oxidoreductase
MKAAVIEKHGELDELHVADVPEPHAARGEAVVNLRAAGMNHLDIWIRKGGRGAIPMPHILGSDGAGVVAAVGPEVKGLREGDEVMIYPGLWCGRCPQCESGQQSECAEFALIGASVPGTFARKIALPEQNCFRKPAYLSWTEAAALPVAYLTAWRMLTSRARLVPGETVLIHGIGGGVAVAALQLAKRIGAEVVVTSSSDEKLAKARALGADHAINYAKVPDVAKAILDALHGSRVDVVVDTVGTATWPVGPQVLRKGGRMVSCGVTTGAAAEMDIRAVYSGQLTIMGSTLGSVPEFRQLLRACQAWEFRPLIDSTFPLAQAREAQGKMEHGQQFGKIVLTME